LDTPRWTLVFILLTAIRTLAQSPLEQAVTLARAQRYAEARKVLENAAEPSGVPQRIAYHRLKAAVASGLGEPANAAGEMRAALELAPTDSGLLAATAGLQAGGRTALAHARAAGNTPAAQALIGASGETRAVCQALRPTNRRRWRLTGSSIASRWPWNWFSVHVEPPSGVGAGCTVVPKSREFDPARRENDVPPAATTCRRR
jgi:hypothetical protein